jgi:hypothetical protein
LRYGNSFRLNININKLVEQSNLLMQVLISQSSHKDLMQSLHSPKEIILNLHGKYEREIYYLTKTETLEIGGFESVPNHLINNSIFLSLKNPGFIGFYHTHTNNGSLGKSTLSSSDINFFDKISRKWNTEDLNKFPLLLGVGSMLSNSTGLLYDIKFYILDENLQPEEIMLHIVA